MPIHSKQAAIEEFVKHCKAIKKKKKKLRHKLSKLDAHPQQVSYVLTYVCVPMYIRTHIVTYIDYM